MVTSSIFYWRHERHTTIESFSDCVGAGYAVSQTYPLQCEAYGKVFVKEGSDPVEVAVENVVTNFGRVMQFVSIGAPKKVVAQAILDNYRTLVSPSLLAAWMQDISRAPGRPLSGPWPDHIAITSAVQINPTTYAVAGNVVEITNDDNVVNEYEVIATVAIVGGNWVITDWTSPQK